MLFLLENLIGISKFSFARNTPKLWLGPKFNLKKCSFFYFKSMHTNTTPSSHKGQILRNLDINLMNCVLKFSWISYKKQNGDNSHIPNRAKFSNFNVQFNGQMNLVCTKAEQEALFRK